MKASLHLPAPATHKPRQRKKSVGAMNVNLDCVFMLCLLATFCIGATLGVSSEDYAAIQRGVLAPRPPRPPTGLAEIIFFNGVELAVAGVDNFPVKLFDYLPFSGQPGYTNVVDGNRQTTTARTIWAAPLKSPLHDVNTSHTNGKPDPTTAKPDPTTAAVPTTPAATTKRAKRDEAPAEDRIRQAAEDVLKHNLDLEQAHINGFRSAGIDEVTMEKLQHQVRVELRRRKRRSLNQGLQGLATTAGIAALQHVFRKFDLVPKAYKKTSHNPGYERGVPNGHPRQLPYDFSGYANQRPELAFGELSGRLGGGRGRVPYAGLF